MVTLHLSVRSLSYNNLFSDLYKELTQIDSLYSFDVGEVVNQLNAVLSKLNHEKGMDEGHQRLLIMSQESDFHIILLSTSYDLDHED